MCKHKTLLNSYLDPAPRNNELEAALAAEKGWRFYLHAAIAAIVWGWALYEMVTFLLKL
jgi:hypothetical protein